MPRQSPDAAPEATRRRRPSREAEAGRTGETKRAHAARFSAFAARLCAAAKAGLGASVVPARASEGSWLLHLDGASRHLHRRDLNERNWGVGFTYEFNPGARWVWSAEGDYFKDSFDDPSGYLGGSLRWRSKYLDAGLIGFVMYRQTARETIGTHVFPGALPFVEFGSRRVRLRTVYIPPVTSRDDEALTLQLLLRF